MQKLKIQGKCPQCTAELQYDADRRVILCEYCGYERPYNEEMKAEGKPFEPIGMRMKESHEIQGIPVSNALAETAANTNWGVRTGAQSCMSCGAQLVFEEQAMATRCPYCGSTSMRVDADVRTIAPARILPFMINRKGLESQIRYYIGNNILVPRGFKELLTEETMMPLYIPFWLFRATAKADFSAKCDGKNVNGRFTKEYEDIAVMASRRAELSKADFASAFTFNTSVEFKPEYLSGYLTERYSVEVKDAWETAKKEIYKRVQDDIKSQTQRHLRCNSVNIQRMDVQYTGETFMSVLAPLWFQSVPFKGRNWFFSIEGQTAAFIGEFPTRLGKPMSSIPYGGAK